ncbi:8298_t:CDS:1 [Paraglomus brasilianum]|uniref:8298_t:CDS:1 n=1 Tax=Paraglomus brasilianum TaxID=144538 RepID=A0A9N8W9A4_9GLOM|nr:8298_t:CDS:1 [Paraglomus brasilianum]
MISVKDYNEMQYRPLSLTLHGHVFHEAYIVPIVKFFIIAHIRISTIHAYILLFLVIIHYPRTCLQHNPQTSLLCCGLTQSPNISKLKKDRSSSQAVDIMELLFCDKEIDGTIDFRHVEELGGSFPFSPPLPTNTKYTTTNITASSRESTTGEICYGRYDWTDTITSSKLPALNLAQNKP